MDCQLKRAHKAQYNIPWVKPSDQIRRAQSQQPLRRVLLAPVCCSKHRTSQPQRPSMQLHSHYLVQIIRRRSFRSVDPTESRSKVVQDLRATIMNVLIV